MGSEITISDDFDRYEFSDAISEFFGVDINRSENDFTTLGEVERYVRSRLQLEDNPSRKCLSAMAFYRVRAALESLGVDGKVSPKDKLSSLAVTPRALARKIRRSENLTPPTGLDPFLLPGKFPVDLTVGDYAKEVAGLNVSRLRELGGGVRDVDIGVTLRAIAANVTGRRARDFDEDSAFV